MARIVSEPAPPDAQRARRGARGPRSRRAARPGAPSGAALARPGPVSARRCCTSCPIHPSIAGWACAWAPTCSTRVVPGAGAADADGARLAGRPEETEPGRAARNAGGAGRMLAHVFRLAGRALGFLAGQTLAGSGVWRAHGSDPPGFRRRWLRSLVFYAAFNLLSGVVDQITPAKEFSEWVLLWLAPKGSGPGPAGEHDARRQRLPRLARDPESLARGDAAAAGEPPTGRRGRWRPAAPLPGSGRRCARGAEFIPHPWEQCVPTATGRCCSARTQRWAVRRAFGCGRWAKHRRRCDAARIESGPAGCAG